MTDGPSGAALWLRSTDAPPAWSPAPISLPPGAERVIAVGDQLVAAAPDDSAGLTLHLLRSAGSTPILSLPHSDAPRWIVPVGASLGVFTADGTGAAFRLSCTIVSLGGTVLYEGPARAVPPVDRREVEALAVLLGSVLLTIGVFILRPAGSYRAAVVPPDGFALADPSRRIVAGAIDLGASLLVAAALFRVPLGEALALTELRATRWGIWPVVAGAAITVFHASIAEALTGRSLGKVITGCRTVAAGGARPALPVALARNAIKIACPPLGLVSLMTPGAAHPGAFGTLVVTPAQSPPPVPPDRP
ncbi:MAG TPA: hypothetical protein DEB06_01865 [Phycisphaerales bacterium]|nr:hypothetical protein [Phycisphaerales bacterium]